MAAWLSVFDVNHSNVVLPFKLLLMSLTNVHKCVQRDSHTLTFAICTHYVDIASLLLSTCYSIVSGHLNRHRENEAVSAIVYFILLLIYIHHILTVCSTHKVMMVIRSIIQSKLYDPLQKMLLHYHKSCSNGNFSPLISTSCSNKPKGKFAPNNVNGGRTLTKVVLYLYKQLNEKNMNANAMAKKNRISSSCDATTKHSVNISLWLDYLHILSQCEVKAAASTISDLVNKMLSFDVEAVPFVVNCLLTTLPITPSCDQYTVFPINNDDWMELEYRIVIETCQELSSIGNALTSVPLCTVLSKQYVQSNYTWSLLSANTQRLLEKHFQKKVHPNNNNSSLE